MPSDIRSFFGGKPSQASQPTPKKEEAKALKAKKGRGRKVIEDDDEEDEEPQPKKTTPKKAPPKKQTPRAPSPKGEDTTASDFFGDSKPKRTAPIKSKPTETTPKASSAKTNGKAAATNGASGRSSTRKSKKTTTYNEDVTVLDDDFDNDDDVFKQDFGNGKTSGDGYDEASEEDVSQPKREVRGKGTQAKIKKDEDAFGPEEDVDMKDANPEDDSVEPDAEERVVVDKPA
ncbi:hypothetical protein LTS18_010743, partial [Coniosporium uncinatum]